MQIPSSSPVVVGVNRSAAALAAVRLAAREAVARGRLLKVVHAFTWPDPRPGAGGTDYVPARRAAAQLIEEAVVTAQRSTPGVRVQGQLVDGPAGRVLLRLSRAAELLVLGGDELAATGRPPPGSPLLEVVAQAWCPVAVARCPRPTAGPVLAAVDGSAYGLLALRFAAQEAARRASPLEIIHVAAGPDAEQHGHRLLDEALAATPEAAGATRRLLVGAPGPTLAHASRRAALIALGPRGLTGSGRLGSVAYEVLRHGGCPTFFLHGPRIPAKQASSRAARRVPS